MIITMAFSGTPQCARDDDCCLRSFGCRDRDQTRELDGSVIEAYEDKTLKLS